jgi:hypothetical protein
MSGAGGSDTLVRVGFLASKSPTIMWLAPSFDNILDAPVFNPWNPDQVAFLREFDHVDDSGSFVSVTTTLVVATLSSGKSLIAATFKEAPSTQPDANGQREMVWASATTLVVPVVGAEGYDPWNHVALVDVTKQSAVDVFAGQPCDVLSYFVANNTLLATHNCFTSTLDTQSITLHNLHELSWVPVVMGKRSCFQVPRDTSSSVR